MAKYINDDIMDAALADLAESAYLIYVCTTAAITTYADVSSANLTTGKSMTSTHFTIGVGDATGRKAAVAQQSSLNVSTSGTAGQIAIVSSASELLLLTSVTTQALTSGNTVTIPTFDYEIADPT
jgi:hypothetical protein